MTERQEKILYQIISDHIDTAQPISSKSLIENNDFEISPATMRIEMSQLEKEGYLMQPHVSSGSVPTDKAYRFFVDKILQNQNDSQESNTTKIKKELSSLTKSDDYIKTTQDLTRKVADLSSNLTMTYFYDDDFFMTQGWENLLLEPEFKQADYMKRFIKMISGIEEEMDQLCSLCQEDLSIYIGKENKLKQSQEFSLIVKKCQTEDGKKAIIALMGPKRMSYQRNISLLNMIDEIFENF